MLNQNYDKINLFFDLKHPFGVAYQDRIELLEFFEKILIKYILYEIKKI